MSVSLHSPLTVRLTNNQERISLSLPKLRKVGQALLKVLGFKKAEIHFLFVNDAEIRKIHRKFLKKDHPTDVIAFGQLEGEPAPDLGKVYLGDVVISVDTAKRQAPLYGNLFPEELILYMVHGVLHILGYDDLRPAPRKRMRRKEKEVMAQLRKKLGRLEV